MKIEQLRLKNLNALVGEWGIDFSDPAYVSAGIFAITGPTGAGKTTLLDALCLALYGQTPRLQTISKSVNDIMSRETGECFAEVTFTTQSGRYRASWSQRKARKQAQGELQLPQRELVDADSGRILASSLREVSIQIIAVTGMDFDRFTRAVVLAQGGFAAFLQASPDERSPILEQLTGTEIYSRISMAVHERRNQERDTLSLAEAALSGIQLLSSEQLAELHETQRHHQEQVTLHQHLQQQLHSAISWHATWQQVSADKQAALLAWETWQHTWQAMQPERERLGHAQKARPIQAFQAQLDAQKKRLADADVQANQVAEEITSHTHLVAQTLQTMHTAHTQRQTHQAQEEAARPHIQAMRTFDVQIQATRNALEQVHKQVRSKWTAYQQAQAQLEKIRQDAAMAQEEAARLTVYITRHQEDAFLDTHWDHLQNAVHQMSTIAARWYDAHTAHHTAIRHCARDTQQLSVLTQALDTLTAEHTIATSSYATYEKDLHTALADQDQSAWRNAWQTAQDQVRIWEQHLENRQKRVHLHQICTQKQHDAETRMRHCQQAEAHCQTAQQMLAAREQVYQLSLQVQELTHLRTTLEDGKPCAVCGSTIHPYRHEAPPTDTSLATHHHQEAKAAVETSRTQLEHARIAWAEARTAYQHAQQVLETHDHAIPETLRLLSDADLLAALSDCKNKAQSLEEKLTQIDTLSRLWQQQKDHLQSLRDRRHQAQQQVQACHYQIQQYQAQQQHAKTLMSEALTTLQSLWQEWITVLPSKTPAETQLWSTLTWSEDSIRSIGDRAAHALRARILARETWQQVSRDKQTLEKRLGLFAESQAKYEALSQQLHQDHADYTTQEQSARTQLDTQEAERRRQYQGQDPDRVEATLRLACQQAEAAYDTAHTAYTAAREALHIRQARYKDLLTLQTQYQQEITDLQHQYHQRLTDAGFATETAYQVACMDDTEYEALTERLTQLTQEKTMSHTRLTEKTAEYDAHMTHLPDWVTLLGQALALDTPDAPSLLHTRLQDCQNRLAQHQQHYGAIQQRLSLDTEQRQKHAAQVAHITTQRTQLETWVALHELIGSGDGKKYRNFAQGLTFEHVVQLANRHLCTMTDRYTLTCDPIQPLLLNVIDHYQGDAQRVTRNLSGGESFIVSLALALGLSHMSSRNVRLDSLFLDEGFGTLDEEVLETALSTLSGLHHQGKTIGIISHIQALKDRISTKIMVHPMSGGRSRLEGPGVVGG